MGGAWAVRGDLFTSGCAAGSVGAILEEKMPVEMGQRGVDPEHRSGEHVDCAAASATSRPTTQTRREAPILFSTPAQAPVTTLAWGHACLEGTEVTQWR